MNILYFFPERDSYMHQWQRIHIFDELERFGYKFHVFNPLKFSSIQEANERLISLIKKGKIKFDLFMNCASSDLLFCETMKEINKIGLRTLLICFDNLHAPFMHKRIAPFFDIVWLTSYETEYMFKQWGCENVVFQTYAANPYRFYPRQGEIKYSIGFVGTPYGGRINKINALTQANILCDIYSNQLSSDMKEKKDNKNLLRNLRELSRLLKFDIGRAVLEGALINKILVRNESCINKNENLRIHGSVSFEKMQEIYSTHALSLNITELRNTYVLSHPIHKIHLRTFEIPMCGGIEFASYTEELSNYFENDKEIILYKSPEEFISKAKFYTDPQNEKRCLKIRLEARLRSEADHTWRNRFERVLKK